MEIEKFFGADLRMYFCCRQNLDVFRYYFNAPQAKNIWGYDVKTGSDGLIHPKTSEFFEGSSGASLRPLCPGIFWILADYDEFEENPRIYRIPKGTQLPDNLIILHERPEYYSLQTIEPVKLSVLNKRCTEFLNQFKAMDANEFQTKYNYVEVARTYTPESDDSQR